MSEQSEPPQGTVVETKRCGNPDCIERIATLGPKHYYAVAIVDYPANLATDHVFCRWPCFVAWVTNV